MWGTLFLSNKGRFNIQKTNNKSARRFLESKMLEVTNHLKKEENREQVTGAQQKKVNVKNSSDLFEMLLRFRNSGQSSVWTLAKAIEDPVLFSANISLSQPLLLRQS